MTVFTNTAVLAETFGANEGAKRRMKEAVLVIAGVAAMAVAANIRVPMWPVPVTMQTFAVLTIGAAYGLRLGLITLLSYLALGVAGVHVFTGDSAGWAYMAGPTGGYLVGYVAAAGVMGMLARAGWDKSYGKMVLAMLIGNAMIYAFGMPWMAHLFLAEKGAEWVFQWGMGNFLLGDALKLGLAAVLLPTMWKLIGR